jgi:DNA-binding response OmpR family regulator
MPRPALIIEDDPDIAESVRYNLETAGFRALVAPTGEQGLSLALDTANPPALIVLDLLLP